MANPITPDTRVHLLSVPLENNMANTLYFAGSNGEFSKSAQETYFLSKAVKSNTDFTYQRKEHAMYVPYLIDDIYGCNYVMYQNHAYSNKWFYAFITNMEYMNDEVTKLTIETDPIQTWFGDITLKQSFVEREHAKYDSIGYNTQPEGLETGDYIVNDDQKFLGLSLYDYILGTTVDPNAEHPDNPSAKLSGSVYNGIASGVNYFYYTGNPTGVSELQAAIANLAVVPDAIQCVFIAPSALIDHDFAMHVVKPSFSPEQIGEILELTPVTNINGHPVRNNKLFCYPYNFIKITNNQGQEAILKPELYETNNSGKYELKIMGAITPGCSIRMFPLNYDGKAVAMENGINLGKYPTCNWATDPYTNWLTQNGLSWAIDTGKAIYETAKPLVNPGKTKKQRKASVESALYSATDVTEQLYQKHLAEIQPPQVLGNINCGDVMTAMGENTFHTMKVSIKLEFAEVIDKYFDMYGYQTNKVKVPYYNHRRNWWYTKTINCNIVGDIPENDMEEIKRCFNTGITFWKNPANMYDYSVDNSII